MNKSLIRVPRKLYRRCVMNTIGLVAQRITRLTTDQKIAGSNPAVLVRNFLLPVEVHPINQERYLATCQGSDLLIVAILSKICQCGANWCGRICYTHLCNDVFLVCGSDQ